MELTGNVIVTHNDDTVTKYPATFINSNIGTTTLPGGIIIVYDLDKKSIMIQYSPTKFVYVKIGAPPELYVYMNFNKDSNIRKHPFKKSIDKETKNVTITDIDGPTIMVSPDGMTISILKKNYHDYNFLIFTKNKKKNNLIYKKTAEKDVLLEDYPEKHMTISLEEIKAFFKIYDSDMVQFSEILYKNWSSEYIYNYLYKTYRNTINKFRFFETIVEYNDWSEKYIEMYNSQTSETERSQSGDTNSKLHTFQLLDKQTTLSGSNLFDKMKKMRISYNDDKEDEPFFTYADKMHPDI